MAHWWNGYPWRVIHPNFREIDTKDFSEDAFLQSLKDFSCNAVMLNAAGLIASYPTRLEDHTRSAYLDGFDMKHLVERCHENGIKVIARTDFSKIPVEVYERHPDWAYRKPDGEPLVYNGYVQTCLSGGYQGGYMDEILKEMFREIPFDGIYCNMGTATGVIVDYSVNRHGPCQCEACRSAFREKYGMQIPAELTRTDKASMVYFRFIQELAGAQKKRITALLREIDPELAYCSVDYVRQESNSEYGRELPHWQYQASSNARAIRGMGQEADVADVDFMGFAYRHVAVDPALQELRLWQTVSNFGGLDYYVMGRLYDKEDRSAYPRVQKVFRYAAEHEDVCYGVTSAADTLLVREAYVIPNPEERGWIRALTESHILFDETLSGGLAKTDLGRYRTIILPEKPRLLPPALEKLEAWVRVGGTLLASGELPKLACFGVLEGGSRNDNALGAMLRVDGAGRPLFMVGRTYLEREYEQGVEKRGALLKPERFGPPELCYPTEASTDLPAAARMPFGEGFGVTIPWYPATNYYTDGFDNWLIFLQFVLTELCPCRPAGKDLHPSVEVTAGRKEDFEVVHFVNASGHFGNSFFDPAVLTDQSVTIPWTKGSAVCENLDEPGNVRWTLNGDQLTVTIPALGAHACVVIKEEK
ncbi:MAG: beta-galactosidase [Oscillospiraceae bacterium]|nr:beta-galactosidase [Oscillospiraceae bacterium]